MNTFIKISLFSVLSLFLLSCSEDDEKPSVNSATFLKEGTEYTMDYNDGFNSGTINTIVEKQIGQDTFLVRNYSEEITTIFPSQYWVLNDDNLYTSFRLRDPETYQIECKFNKPVGTTWPVTKGSATYAYTIEALNVSVTTGKGVINDAIKIKMQSGGNIYYQYISPTVGLLGDGSSDDESTTLKLTDYTIGTTSSTTVHVPAVTYGTFPFLKVNNYWNYSETSFFNEEAIPVKLEIVSKDSKNIYKIKLTYDTSEPVYSYWYEDNGMLMVYEEDETYLNADPIYMDEDVAEVGYGWVGLTGNSTFYIYKIESLGETQNTYFGNLACMGILVSDGLFTSQINYWNQNKGNVLVSGAFVSRDISSSNARENTKTPFIPIIAFNNGQ